jgi:hypothetical protein
MKNEIRRNVTNKIRGFENQPFIEKYDLLYGIGSLKKLQQEENKLKLNWSKSEADIIGANQ